MITTDEDTTYLRNCLSCSMEFGHLYEGIANVDFTLPPDSDFTKQVLRDSAGGDKFDVHVGCSKWGHKGWIGSLYPPRTSEKDFLKEYVKQFNSIEFGPTFYKIYKAEEIMKWKVMAEERSDFKFCPKFPQTITHIRRLANAEQQTKDFYEGVRTFGQHLGAMLLQMGEPFSPKSFPQLKDYLEQLPTDVPVFVEVRQKDWFAVTENREKLFNLLHQTKIGAVITDAAGRRDCVHMQLTLPHAFIRFVGHNDEASDHKRVNDWVQRIKEWKEAGLQSLWFFCHQHDETFSPQLCDYFIKQLNDRLGMNVARPNLLEP